MLSVKNIVGICGLEVHQPNSGIWEIWMLAQVKVGDKKEFYQFTVSNDALFLTEGTREKARHKRDLILLAMADGIPIWIQLDPNNKAHVQKLYAHRDFGWTDGPKRFKIRAMRKT